jgi:soluble lytic murein transglycosylase-like protein
MRSWRHITLLLCLAASASAADLAILRNGFTIRHFRRVQVGSTTRLYLSGADSNYVEVPSADIERFELDTALPPATAAPVPPAALPISEVIARASARYRLDPDFVTSVVAAESGFNARAVSRKGAQGLMQLMPQTAAQLGVQNAFDPTANVEGGTKYLRILLERYHFDAAKALAAYNAGPQTVELHQGVPPYRETRAYVSQVIRSYNRKKGVVTKPNLRAKAKPTPPSRSN